MKIDHDAANIRLTSGEIGELWTNYVYDNMSQCVASYFLEKCQDTDIRSLIEYDLSNITRNLQRTKEIFNSVNFPIPIGFTEEDVHLNAGKLYSDVFMLHYTKIKSKFELINFSASRFLCARADVIEHFNACISSELDICNRADDILLSKGLFIRSPYIPVPEQVEFVKKQSFMAGFIGDKRPLQAREIGYAFINTQTNALGKALLLGFAQVVKDKKIQEFMSRGKEIAEKHFEVFSNLLKQEDIPAPMLWDSEVLNSTEAPFSDELMMFHTVALIGYGMGAYGLSLSTALRRDVSLTYTRLIAEVGQFLDDGAKIMIDNNWLEAPPQAPKRGELSKA
jgi:hypothetical protein